MLEQSTLAEPEVVVSGFDYRGVLREFALRVQGIASASDSKWEHLNQEVRS